MTEQATTSSASPSIVRPVRDMAIPTLPARDMDETLAYYDRLGFRLRNRFNEFGGDYAIVVRGDLELHFFGHAGIDPRESYGGCYLRVMDVDALFAELQGNGVECLSTLEDKPWGLREFAIVDPSGNLLRIGQPLDALAGPEPRADSRIGNERAGV